MKDVQSSRGSNTNIELGTLELEIGPRQDKMGKSLSDKSVQ